MSPRLAVAALAAAALSAAPVPVADGRGRAVRDRSETLPAAEARRCLQALWPQPGEGPAPAVRFAHRGAFTAPGRRELLVLGFRPNGAHADCFGETRWGVFREGVLVAQAAEDCGGFAGAVHLAALAGDGTLQALLRWHDAWQGCHSELLLGRSFREGAEGRLPLPARIAYRREPWAGGAAAQAATVRFVGGPPLAAGAYQVEVLSKVKGRWRPTAAKDVDGC